MVDRANTVSFGRLLLQLPPSPLRACASTWAKFAVLACADDFDGGLAVFHGPRCVARFDADGRHRPDARIRQRDIVLAAVKDAARRSWRCIRGYP